MNLNPCPYRHADDEGHILCDKIKSGDREVTPNICRVCPVAQINCAHLRATLDHQTRPPIVVRWGNGKSQVWDDVAQDSIALTRGACAEKVLPIHSPRDCVGCPLRKPLVIGEQLAVSGQRTAAPRVARRAPAPAPTTQPIAQAAPPPAVAASGDARSNIVVQKIIQLQEWLAKQNRAPQTSEEEESQSVAYAEQTRARVVGEEKRVGWTD